MNYQTYNNNSKVVYVIPQNKTNNNNCTKNQMTTPTYSLTPESVVSNTNNNKRLHNYPSSDSLCKRRRVSPISVNTVKRNYPVYVQQQPVIVTNYYKPVNTQNKVVVCKPQHQHQTKAQKPKPVIDASNQFKVTQVSEVFHGCSELSLPKLVIYLIYKIWCCCNISQYQKVDQSNGYATPESTSPISPESEYHDEKIGVLYRNISQSKIFQEQPVAKSNECVISIDSDEEDTTSKKEAPVDPKDLETQILKACSRSCRGELKNNYSKLIDYVEHLLKITQISFSSVILALEYIYRLKEASQTPEGKFLNQWSYEEIIPISFMMANKYVSDDRYSNTVWANVTNISLNHLNDLEMKGLIAISFRLYVSENNYNDWIHLIKTASRELSLKYTQLKQPQRPPKVQVPVVSYKLSPNPYTSINSSQPTSTTSTTTPSSNLNTAIYSPMTPSKIQQTKKIPVSNVYVTRESQPKSHVINIIPVTRVFKGQSQPTVVSIPANQRMNIPPFQSSTIGPKVQTTTKQPVVFFPKLNVNTTESKVNTVVRQNVCIYPSPPLSRTASPNTGSSIERYHQNKNTNTIVHPQYKFQPSYASNAMVNPYIKGFPMH